MKGAAIMDIMDIGATCRAQLHAAPQIATEQFMRLRAFQLPVVAVCSILMRVNLTTILAYKYTQMC